MNGYACPTCGAWLAYGSFHMCYGNNFVATPAPAPNLPFGTKVTIFCDHCYCKPSGKDHKECCNCDNKISKRELLRRSKLKEKRDQLKSELE